eukprot:COSAG06_NODE_9273_length_1942_cov_1.620184_2_plen_459_part_00
MAADLPPKDDHKTAQVLSQDNAVFAAWKPDDKKLLNDFEVQLREYYLNAGKRRDSRVVIYDRVLDVAIEAMQNSSGNGSDTDGEHSSGGNSATTAENSEGGEAGTVLSTFACTFGHNTTSPLCTLCEDEWVGGSTGLCHSCVKNNTAQNIGIAAMLFIFFYGLFVFVPLKLYQKNEAKQKQLKEIAKSDGLVRVGNVEEERAGVHVYAKILLSHFQVLMQLHLVMDVDYPPQFNELLSFLSIIKGDILSILNVKCAYPMDLFFEFKLAMGLLPTCLFILVLWKGQKEFRSRRKQQKLPGGESGGESNHLSEQLYHDRADPVLMFSCRHLQTLTGDATADQLNNYEDAELHIEHWHNYDYSIDCSGEEYGEYENWAYFMILVYPIGVPAFAFAVFWMNRDRLQDLASSREEGENDNDAASSSGRSISSMPSSFDMSSMPWWFGDRSTFHFMVRDYKAKL